MIVTEHFLGFLFALPNPTQNRTYKDIEMELSQDVFVGIPLIFVSYVLSCGKDKF